MRTDSQVLLVNQVGTHLWHHRHRRPTNVCGQTRNTNCKVSWKVNPPACGIPYSLAIRGKLLPPPTACGNAILAGRWGVVGTSGQLVRVSRNETPTPTRCCPSCYAQAESKQKGSDKLMQPATVGPRVSWELSPVSYSPQQARPEQCYVSRVSVILCRNNASTHYR